jgi:hypothetical protein
MIRISVLAMCLAASGAMAQSNSENLRKPFDPGDPGIKGAAVDYRSVFGGDEKPQPETTWPQANQDMSRLKGHAGHIRDGEPEPALTGAPRSSSPPPHHQH